MHHDATHHAANAPGTSAESLAPLGALPGFRLAEGEPDIRGWELLASDGRRLGVIDELLVDRQTGEVSALAVRVADGLVAVPMAPARIDTRARAVVSNLTPERFAALPRGASQSPVAAGAPATGSVQPAPSGAARAGTAPTATRDAAAGPAGHPGVTVERTAAGEEIVRVPVVEEELVVERRPVVKEVVVIRKRAAQEERVIEADLKRERIEVDRPDQS